MTEQASSPTASADVALPPQADDDAGLQSALDRLLVAAQALRWAIDVAKEIPQTTRNAQVAPRQIFTNWRAANLLVQTAFDVLYGEVLNNHDIMTLMLRPRD